jgi:hypothetical protein
MSEPAISMVSELTTDPRTADLVGQRVRPRRPTDGEDFPSIAYSKISDPHDYTQDGDSGLRAPRVQFSCWARDPDTADLVADALVDVLSGRSFGEVTFTFVIDDRDDYEPETGLYRRIVDAMPHLEG